MGVLLDLSVRNVSTSALLVEFQKLLLLLTDLLGDGLLAQLFVGVDVSVDPHHCLESRLFTLWLQGQIFSLWRFRQAHCSLQGRIESNAFHVRHGCLRSSQASRRLLTGID